MGLVCQGGFRRYEGTSKCYVGWICLSLKPEFMVVIKRNISL